MRLPLVNQPVRKKIRAFQRWIAESIVREGRLFKLEERAEYLVRLFENYLSPASRILDIGGGPGFYFKPLESRGHSLTILDVARPAFQKAPVVLYEGGTRFPFADKSFDVSLIITALHHISDPEYVVSEARRVTKKTLVVVEDLYHHWLGKIWTILRDRLYNFEFFGHPCQFRKKEEWLSLFSKEGLSVVEQTNVYTWIAGLRILNGVFILKV